MTIILPITPSQSIIKQESVQVEAPQVDADTQRPMASKVFSLCGVDTPFDPDYTLVTSHILSPIALLSFRFSIAVYALVSIIFSIIWHGVVLHDINRWFSYFTNICFVGLCAYFWVSSFHTLSYVLALKEYGSETEKPSYALQRWPRILQLLHVLLLTTIFVYPFIVAIVYWVLLAGSQTFETAFYTWSNITFHTLNAIFSFAEMLYNRYTPRWINLVALVILIGCYLGVAYLTYASQGFYTYDFLDPSDGAGNLIKYYAIILAGVLVVFLIAVGLCRLRDMLLGRRSGTPPHSDEVTVQGTQEGKTVPV
ncbi:hypothetical protein FRC03_010060 [Tulasnella sp. 419]|nr:hypothetical protein FRC03_010060 [Tulasnella sp. 419]